MKKTISILLAMMLAVSGWLFSAVPAAYADEPVSFNEVDGGTFTSGEEEVTVLVFNYLEYTAGLMSELAAAPWIGADGFRIAFVDINQNSRETVKAAKDRLNSDDISYCYDTTSAANITMWGYLSGMTSVSLPVTVYLDKDSVVQKVTTGSTTTNEIFANIQAIHAIDYDESADYMKARIPMQYCQTEARSILPMINEMRASAEDAWVWNSDDTEKIYYNNLQPLTYDAKLEAVAMQRAAEIAVAYGHTRPNGESCFSAYPAGYGACGENIAAGYLSAEEVNTAWREDNFQYSGQGHRRAMLNGNYTAVGIGCVYYNGTYYWAEEFSSNNQSPEPTEPIDGDVPTVVQVKKSELLQYAIAGVEGSLTINEGDSSVTVPEYTVTFCCNNTWPANRQTQGTLIPNWQSENPAVATVNSDYYIVGNSVGTTNLFFRFFDDTKTLTVTVKSGEPADLSALNAAVAAAQSLNSEDYSPSSYQALADLAAQYQDADAETMSQEEADSATEAILAAISALEPYLNLSVQYRGGDVQVTTEAVSENNGVYVVPFGKTVTLTATPDAYYVFAGWYDTVSRRIFSTDTTYTFKMTANTSLEARFVAEQSASLYFKNTSGYIKATVTKTAAEWAEVTDLGALLPEVPYAFGKTNGTWQYDEAAVLAKLMNGEDAEIIAVYDTVDETRPAMPQPDNENGIPALNMTFSRDTENNVGTFMMAAAVPEGCRTESVGIAFYYKKETLFDPTGFTVTLNNKMTASTFVRAENNDYYTVNVRKFNLPYNWAARGYVTYYDAQGALKTAYSNQINVVAE